MLRVKIFLVLGILIGLATFATGQCTTPSLPADAYTLTTEKASYTSGEIYEIFCKPGFTISGSSNLTCSGTTWTPGLPSCSKTGVLPWWVLLICVVAGIILIPCILPRVWACICNRKKPEDDEQPLTKEKAAYHGKGGHPKPITPVTDHGKHRLTQIDAFHNKFPDSVNPYAKNANF